MSDNKTTSISTSTNSSPMPVIRPQISSLKTIDKILGTVYEMFSDRGYTVIPRTNWTKPNQQTDDLKVIATYENNDLNNLNYVFVYFATDQKVSVKKMREYILHMDENKITHSIIVYGQQITPSAKNEIKSNYRVENFKARELFENITRHHLVPKHEKIETAEEVQALLKKYYLTNINQLPKYDPNEKVVRYYGWTIGTIVKIYRKLGNQKDSEIYYRVVRI